jgi:hypothetical protein
MTFSPKILIRFAAVICIGLATGYLLRGQFGPSALDRHAHRVFDRFASICLSAIETSPPAAFLTGDDLGLPAVATGADTVSWIDTDSNGILSVTNRRCGLEFYQDTASHLIDAADILQSRTADFLADHVPHLTIDPKAKLNPNDRFVAWTNWADTRTGDERRWGLTLLAGRHTVGEPYVSLSVTLPWDQ